MTTELLELREKDDNDSDENDPCLDEETDKKEYDKTIKKLEKFNEKQHITGQPTFVDKDKFNPNDDLDDDEDDEDDDDDDDYDEVIIFKSYL